MAAIILLVRGGKRSDDGRVTHPRHFALSLALLIGIARPVCLATPPSLSGDSPSPTPPPGLNLSSSAISSLIRGEPVVREALVPGSPWPRVTVFKRVDAPPDLAAGVFLDYESAPRFIRKLESVEVVSQRGMTKEVEYQVRLPVFMSVGYRTRNTYSREGEAHVVKWELVRSSLASSGSGEFRVAPWGEGSLMVYSSEVVPSSGLVASLRSMAVEEVKSTAESLAKEAARRSSTTTAPREAAPSRAPRSP